ncbi:MAG: ATP-binding protein [Pseudomonadota bacterium]
MHRLVWKFWLAIWLVIAVMLLTGLLVVSQWQRFESYNRAVSHPHDRLQALADRIEGALTRGMPVEVLLHDHEFERFGEVFLVDRSGRDLLGRPIPSAIALGKPALRTQHDRRAGEAIFARAIWTGEERTHFMIFQIRERPSLLWIVFGSLGLSGVLLLSMAAAGLIASVLAVLVVRPLNRLAGAVSNQRQGSVSPIAAELLDRRDEIGELARALDCSSRQTRNYVVRQQEFVRDVSHEVRAPLARLQVAAEVAELKSSDEQAMARVHAEVRTIDQLVARLLRLSRANDESLQDSFACCDLAAILSRAIDNSAALAESKAIEVRLVSEDTARRDVWGDTVLLVQVFENLLANAIHHSPTGELVLVSLGLQDSAVFVVIEDNGPGVPREHLERIFEPFVRLDAARRRSTGNFGIGLAFVRKVIETHQGCVRALEPDARGLKVEVSLPCVVA